MARISLAEVSRGTEAVLLRGDPEMTVDSYSIDTRTLQSGDLFFALVGPNHDAHRFVAEAIRKGAKAVVISRGRAGDFPEGAAVLRVADTTRALQELAHWVRRSRAVKVIGITGSSGKTTTKEMTAAIMEEAMPTLKSSGNLNNTYGLPLCLLGLEADHQAAVLEMGMSFPGEISRLAAIADPDVGVLLNVYPVHLEHFPSVSEIADAKGELFQGMRQDAVAVFNADDPEATRVAHPFPGRKIGFGFTAAAQVKGVDLQAREGGGTAFGIEGLPTMLEVEIPFPGRHHVANALAAAAATHAAGAGTEAIRSGLARTRPLPMRGALLRFPGGVRVLDETYNSNPKAMEKTLESLSRLQAQRRIVASGDMLELGDAAPAAHRALGEQVARSSIALFVTVGPLSKHAAESARSSGMESVRHFEDSSSAATFLAGALQPGDLVLVKGSRGMALERIVEAIRASRGKEEA
ncbi:MAG TPA: UDP-N-acetylmuramoyl-tripeptide--D-alanyl-D-alanine ligase [Candidatus Polarisedimenticolia bacterium]|nr:UDP-N-acetylmuramoyl-tripeptide--D-alanyl-D-alanine ligase [Candidatus Polarisedimenticolia bacterium]